MAIVQAYSLAAYRKNVTLFRPPSESFTWKQQFLTPKAIVGGFRRSEKPIFLYRRANRNSSDYVATTNLQDMTGTNELGDFKLSKHRFNLTFLADPFRANPAKKSSIEAIYQLGNYKREADGRHPVDHERGLFLDADSVTVDAETFKLWGRTELWDTIRHLRNNVQISLPCYERDLEGWFVPMFPPIGERAPCVTASFVREIYHQLESSNYLVKEMKNGRTVYRLARTEDGSWTEDYGKLVSNKKFGEQCTNYSEAVKRVITLHVNSSQYFGPLEMYCAACGNLSPVSDSDNANVNWYNLALTDPRENLLNEATPYVCRSCETKTPPRDEGI